MGKAKLSNTSIDTIKAVKSMEKKQAGRIRADFAGVSTQSVGINTVGSSNENNNRYSQNGGRISGPISFFPKTIDIVDGAIDLADQTDATGNVTPNTSNVNVIGEGNAADDLTTINSNSDTGQVIFLKAAGYQLTLKHGTGNQQILTPGATDYVMEDDEGCILMFGSTGNTWMVLGSSGGGSVSQWATFAAATDIDFGTFDGINIDRLIFALDSGTVDGTTTPQIYVSSNDNELVFNNSINDFLWTHSNVISLIDSINTFEKRDIVAPNMNLNNNRAFQTGTAGTFGFYANSQSSGNVAMAFLIGNTETATGTSTGSLQIGVRESGVATNYLFLNDADSGEIDVLTDINMASNEIKQAVSIDFNASGTNDASITSSTSGLAYSAAVNDNHIFAINANPLIAVDPTELYFYTGVGINMNSNVINMNGGDITEFDTLQSNGSGSEIEMRGGFINMDDGEIRDADDITIHARSRILAEGNREFGIQVDNASATVGNAGMLAMPISNLTTYLTKAVLDSAFGDHDGAMGFDVNTLANLGRLWIRSTTGNWFGFDYDASVTS